MATVRTIFFLCTTFFAFAAIHAAPARYDQRQEGEFNVAAKLENLLFLVVIPSDNDKLTQTAWAAIEALALASRSKDLFIKSGEAVHQEEPYSVEIINEIPEKQSSVRKAEGDVETSNVSDQQPTPVGDEKAEKAERVARNVKNFEFPKSRDVPTVPGYFVNVRKTSGLKTGDNGRARNVVGNVWNPDDEPGRPGTSLKKQLPQKAEKDVASQPSSADKNDVSLVAEEKQQELRLLGDGVENCGPGRRRDASGVCQFDGSTASLL